MSGLFPAATTLLFDTTHLPASTVAMSVLLAYKITVDAPGTVRNLININDAGPAHGMSLDLGASDHYGNDGVWKADICVAPDRALVPIDGGEQHTNSTE